MKLVDMTGLNSVAKKRVGSNPTLATKDIIHL